jgi:hypothetical protein
LKNSSRLVQQLQQVSATEPPRHETVLAGFNEVNLWLTIRHVVSYDGLHHLAASAISDTGL